MCDLLELARLKQGNISYYEIAKRLNVSDQLVRSWQHNKSKPNGINTLKLADMAGVDVVKAIKIVESGYSNVSLLGVTALLSTLGLAPFYNAAQCILCKIKLQLSNIQRAKLTRLKFIANA